MPPCGITVTTTVATWLLLIARLYWPEQKKWNLLGIWKGSINVGRISKKAALLLTDLSERMSDLTAQTFITLECSPLSEWLSVHSCLTLTSITLLICLLHQQGYFSFGVFSRLFQLPHHYLWIATGEDNAFFVSLCLNSTFIFLGKFTLMGD